MTDGSVLLEKVGEMAASQVFAWKGAQTGLEPTFGVVDDPFVAAVVKHVALCGMPTCQRVHRRVDSAYLLGAT